MFTTLSAASSARPGDQRLGRNRYRNYGHGLTNNTAYNFDNQTNAEAEASRGDGIVAVVVQPPAESAGDILSHIRLYQRLLSILSITLLLFVALGLIFEVVILTNEENTVDAILAASNLTEEDPILKAERSVRVVVSVSLAMDIISGVVGAIGIFSAVSRHSGGRLTIYISAAVLAAIANVITQGFEYGFIHASYGDNRIQSSWVVYNRVFLNQSQESTMGGKFAKWAPWIELLLGIFIIIWLAAGVFAAIKLKDNIVKLYKTPSITMIDRSTCKTDIDGQNSKNANINIE